MQVKKILAIFLAAALIFSLSTVNVGAENNGIFKVGVVAETATPISSNPAIYNAGDEISVKISVGQNTGVTFLGFALTFNTDALEFVDATSHELLAGGNIVTKNVANGRINYKFMSNNSIVSTGDLFTVNFKAVTDTCIDNVEFGVEIASDASCKNGSVNVPFEAETDSFALHTIDATTGVVTDPTCTEEGFTTYHCSVCDSDVVGNIVDALGHKESDPVEENRVEPDCENDGSFDTVVYCTVCGEELSRETTVLNALGHRLENVPKKDPTCTEGGWTAYQECVREGCDYVTPNVLLPATGHTESEIIVENRVEADCVNDGSYDNVVYCTVCGEELSRETIVIPALGHRLENAPGKKPTCTEGGWTSYQECARCDYVTPNAILPALGHTEGEVVYENVVEPDCVNAGSHDEVVYCTVCGEELSRVTVVDDALGHTEGEVVVENRVEADCVNDGSYDNVVYCTVCGEELSRETVKIDALGHDLTTHDAKAPTCTEIGWDAYDTCSRCDYSTYKEIPALGHTEAEVVVEDYLAPTCTVVGSYNSVVYCSVCDVKLSSEFVVVDALGHDLTTHDAKAPTCTEIGWDAYDTCSRCDYTTYVEKEPVPHTPEKSAIENHKEPTCVDKGSFDIVVYCSVCDTELSRKTQEIAATGHILVNYDAKAPTCTEIGHNAYSACAKCDYTTYEEIPALGHTNGAAVVENRIEPDCVNKGSYDSVVYCTVCGAEVSRETVEIEALGHTYGDTTVVEPSYQEEGYSVHTCTVCGFEEKFDFVDALEYIIGDCNNDGKINNKDVGILLQHINTWEVEINIAAADVNADGKINNKDLGLLLQYINKWDVQLGK